MNKKIGFGIIATLMIAGAAVFANTTTANNCPDKPGCVCSKQTMIQVAKPQTVAIAKKENCLNKPGCICN